MNSKVLWLRISYWVGAVIDGFAAILMLFPKLFVSFVGINLTPDAGLYFGLRYGAPLMLGWTVLLIWADRRPLERKGVLLITLLPVVVGYVILEIAAISTGISTFWRMFPNLVMQAMLIGLFTYSYVNAEKQ
jgi:hypothetical protein